MIRHIVTWKLAAEDAGQRRADAEAIRARIEGLRGIVPAQRLEIGIDLGDTDGNWDVVLDSDFSSAEELAAYQVHPAHVEVAGFVRSVVVSRSCVDYHA